MKGECKHKECPYPHLSKEVVDKIKAGFAQQRAANKSPESNAKPKAKGQGKPGGAAVVEGERPFEESSVVIEDITLDGP